MTQAPEEDELARLVAFLLAWIGEREATARAAPGPRWQQARERLGRPGHWHGTRAELVTLPARDPFDTLSVGEELLRAEGTDARQRGALIRFVTANAPDAVLADLASKRAIIAKCQDVLNNHFSDDFTADNLAVAILQTMAAPFVAHPGFDPAWRTA